MPKPKLRSGIYWRSILSLRRMRARTSEPGTSRAASWIQSSRGCAKRGSRFPRTGLPTRRGGARQSRQKQIERSRERFALRKAEAGSDFYTFGHQPCRLETQLAFAISFAARKLSLMSKVKGVLPKCLSAKGVKEDVIKCPVARFYYSGR